MLVFNDLACKKNNTKFIMINAITKALINIFFENFSGFIQEKSRKNKLYLDIWLFQII